MRASIFIKPLSVFLHSSFKFGFVIPGIFTDIQGNSKISYDLQRGEARTHNDFGAVTLGYDTSCYSQLLATAPWNLFVL